MEQFLAILASLILTIMIIAAGVKIVDFILGSEEW